ncbi:MAG TPA: hypothetical protein VK813_08980 [Edaphobacter sp.]|jgi:hypothetical protein|nr:hypothetical protein [Edaphobacter sp.]
MITKACRLFTKEAPIATGVFIGLAEGTKDWTDGDQPSLASPW